MTAEDGMSRIGSFLRRRERLFRLKTGAMLTCGLPLSLVGPLLLSTMFWSAAFMFGYQGVRWSWLFWGSVVVVIPLLYRLELRTGGDYLGTAIKGAKGYDLPGFAIAPGPYGPLLGIVSAVANPTHTSAGFVEIFLFGPRLVVDAWKQMKVAGQLKNADLDRAAGIVSYLAARQQGTETANLLRRGERFEDLVVTFAYLSFHQWIGVGDGWKRVWLSTESRKLLE